MNMARNGVLATLILVLNGCSCSGEGARPYAIDARIDGLVGSRLALSNNGVNVVVAPGSNGRISGLYSGLANGASYDITVATQPTNPAQTCVVANGKGTIAKADAEMFITCATTPARYLLVQPYPIRGSGGSSDRCIRASAIDSSSGSLAAPNGTPLCGPELTSVDGNFRGGTPVGPMAVHSQGKFVYMSITQTRFGCLCRFVIDDNGVVSFVQGAALLHPSSVAVHPSGQFIFFSSNGLQDDGHVTTYSVAASSGALTGSSGFDLGSANTRAVMADPLGRFVYVFFAPEPFSSHQVMSLVVDSATGALSRLAAPVTAAGDLLAAHPSGKFLYVGKPWNAITVFQVDSTTGALTPVSGSPFMLANGSILSVAAIDPAGNRLYALDFASSNIFAYAIDRNTGQLAAINGSPFATGRSPRSVAIEPQGNFIYVSNDLGVSAYAIDSANGALTPISGSPFALGIGGEIAFSY